MKAVKSSPSIPTFLKWAGGKRRIIPLIEKFFPEKIERYFEPFLGGGSVFFYVKQKYNPSYCMISDTNLDLVNVYIHVRDDPKQLIKYLTKFRKEHSKVFYYSVRDSFNRKKFDDVQRSAAFIYLNKTCFNGLYRVNRKNEFNVPLGRFKTQRIFEKEGIFAASEILNDRVMIKHQDYKNVLSYVRRKDFVYLDPCYDPLKRSSFANYTPERFSKEDRTKLHTFVETLRGKRVKVVLSNNDIPEVRKLYSTYEIGEIIAPRSIGSRPSYRSSITELVISTNV